MLGITSRKEKAMERRTSLALLTLLSLLFGIAPANSSPSSLRAASTAVRLEEATMIVEVNATDGDAGLQVFLDGEPWSSMTISAPPTDGGSWPSTPGRV
jgi:uncharacterized membrane protein